MKQSGKSAADSNARLLEHFNRIADLKGPIDIDVLPERTVRQKGPQPLFHVGVDLAEQRISITPLAQHGEDQVITISKIGDDWKLLREDNHCPLPLQPELLPPEMVKVVLTAIASVEHTLLEQQRKE